MSAVLTERVRNAVAPLCMECDGTGLDGDSGNGWWEQTDCPHCDGSGYLNTDHEYSRADYLADQADAANDEAALHGEAL